MPRSTAHEHSPGAHAHQPDAFTEFAEELRQLAETVLERVEPALRGAAEDRPEWSSCSWCPVCATAALLRGEHHDVLTAIADHGTAIVTVLREALAGAPVEPVLPEENADPDVAAAHGAADADTSGGGAARDRTGDTGTGAQDDSARQSRSARRAATPRRASGYTDIPVTIRT